MTTPLLCTIGVEMRTLDGIKLLQIFYLSLSALQYKSMSFCGVYPNGESPSHRAVRHLIVSAAIKPLMIRMQKNINQRGIFLAFTITRLQSRQWLCRREEIQFAVCVHGFCSWHVLEKRVKYWFFFLNKTFLCILKKNTIKYMIASFALQKVVHDENVHVCN